MVRALYTDGTDRVLLRPPGDAAPGSQPLTDAFVPTKGGDVHALVARPATRRTARCRRCSPCTAARTRPTRTGSRRYRAAWLDAGFAVVHVNYRGSTGYGSAWRDAIEGRPGLTELEDVAAVHDVGGRVGAGRPGGGAS